MMKDLKEKKSDKPQYKYQKGEGVPDIIMKKKQYNNKSGKKQAVIKKKHKKFEKSNIKTQKIPEDEESQSKIYTQYKYSPQKSPNNSYVSAKMLIMQNNRFGSKTRRYHNYDNQSVQDFTNTFTNQYHSNSSSMKKEKSYRSLSPSPIKYSQQKTPITPFESKTDYGLNINQSQITCSPGNEFNEHSREINVVKHKNNLWPILPKSKDVLDEIEKLKEGKTVNKANNNSPINTNTNIFTISSYKIQDDPTCNVQIKGNNYLKQSTMDKLYVKSVGNKYIQLIIQNYKEED